MTDNPSHFITQNLKKLFSFEILFILFLFSYQYKNALSPNLSFDVTLTLIALLIPFALFLWYKNPRSPFLNETIISLGLFTLWVCFSIAWSPLNIYAFSKILCFIIYTIPAFLMAHLIISRSQVRLQRFIFLTILFAILVHFEAYRTFIQNSKLITNVLGNNYLITGQTLGVGFLFLVAGSFFQLREKLKSLSIYGVELLFCGTLFYIQLNLGGRGPVLAAGFSLLLFYLIGFFKSPHAQIYIKHSLHLLIICLITYVTLRWLLDTETSHFIARLTAFPEMISQDETITTRFEYYHSALQAYHHHPFLGLGFGGWPFYHGLGDLEWHPHNIFLEVLSETGTIGALLFIRFLYFSLRRISLSAFTNSCAHTSMLLLLSFSFLNALKSGDLNDNVLLFVALGLVSGLSTRPIS